MNKGLSLPEIPDSERSPLVGVLLGIIESLSETVQRQEEEIGCLKDQIAILKGEKARPNFKPSGMEEKTEDKSSSESGEGNYKRAGSEKRSKTQQLVIHEEQVIRPPDLATGSRFNGYRDYVVQDLQIESHNTRYRLECWQTRDGEWVCGELPLKVCGHYGPQLQATVKYLHHHSRIPQPPLREMQQESGIDISAGQMDALLCQQQALFQSEKDELLRAGLEVSPAITVDDTGHRHPGQNAYSTHIGNDDFAWFASTAQKNRLNFLTLLRAGETQRTITAEGLAYIKQQGLPQEPQSSAWRRMRSKTLPRKAPGKPISPPVASTAKVTNASPAKAFSVAACYKTTCGRDWSSSAMRPVNSMCRDSCMAYVGGTQRALDP